MSSFKRLMTSFGVLVAFVALFVLAPANAAKLYGMVHRHGLYATKVIVHSAPKEPAVAKGKGKSYEQASARPARYQGQMAQRKMRPTGGSAWGF